MPCTNSDHRHIWPKSGSLVIQRCETRCGLCVGAAAQKDWKHAWFTRRHAETHVRSGQFPDLIIDAGWDKHHPTGVSFNKARTFKLKSMKNPKTKVGPALSASSRKVHKGDIQRNLELEDSGAASDSHDSIPLQARGSHRRHTVAAPNEESLGWSAQSPSDAKHGLHLHTAAEINATFVDHPSTDDVELDTRQAAGAPHLKFEEVAFPCEIAMNDLIYDVHDGTTHSRMMEDCSVIPSTNDSRRESTSMQQSDDDGHDDILRTIQRIAEGRMSSGVLPASMKLYISGILEINRIDETVLKMNGCSTGARSRDAQALVDRVIFREGALFLDDCAEGRGYEVMQLLRESVLDSSHHNSLPASAEPTESIFAVALGRMFATAHEGKLVTENCGSDFPALPQPALSSSKHNSHAHLCPTDIERCIRMMPGLTDLPKIPAPMLCETQDSWGFPLEGADSSLGAQSLRSHHSTLSDLAQIVNRGIPTVGELSNLSNSGCGTFASASIALQGVASRHDDFPAVLSFLDPAFAHGKADQTRHTTSTNMLHFH